MIKQIYHKIFSVLVFVQYFFLLGLLFGAASYLPSKSFFLNQFNTYTPEMLYMQIALNGLALISTFHFTHSKRDILISKIVLVIVGLYTFPVGVLSLLIGLMVNDNLKVTHKAMLSKIHFEEPDLSHQDIFSNVHRKIKTSWSITHKKKGFMALLTVIALLFTGSLMRTTVVVEDYQYVAFVRIPDEEVAVSFTGDFRFEKIDDSHTKVIVPRLLPQAHFTRFDDPELIYFNYRINNTWAHDEAIAYFDDSDNHRIDNTFVISQSREELMSDFEIEFVFTEISEDDSEVIMAYTVSEAHITSSAYIYNLENFWVWEGPRY